MWVIKFTSNPSKESEGQAPHEDRPRLSLRAKPRTCTKSLDQQSATLAFSTDVTIGNS